jgi:hypothetical protein
MMRTPELDETSAAPAVGVHLIPLAVWRQGGSDDTAARLRWGLYALATEVVNGYHYVVGLPVLLGLWAYRRLWRVPGAWVVGLVSLGLCLLLWRLASVMGYLSERHTLLLLLCGSFWAAAGIGVAGSWVAGLGARWRWPVLQHAGCVSVLLLLALAGFCMPETLQPLHANRSGFRPAGLWIAEHADPWDPVIDPYCWSHYYAGAVFREGDRPAPPPGRVPTYYVVLESGGSDHVRLSAVAPAQVLVRQRGKEVYRWTGQRVVYRWTGRPRKVQAVEVVVYAVPGQ